MTFRTLVRVLPAALAAWAIAFFPLGCGSAGTGYTFQSAHSAEVRSISVPIFENLTVQTGLEVELTDAIIKELQTRTSWAVTRADRAQTTLSGSITQVRMRPLSSVPVAGLVEDTAFQMTVDFEFRDNLTGKTLVSRRSFSAVSTFTPAVKTGERLETGEHAGVQQMAASIVSELRSSW